MINLEAELLDILACPRCKAPLRVEQATDELVCSGARCGLAYPVRDDIPVLLVDEARHPETGDSADADQPGTDSDEDKPDA